VRRRPLRHALDDLPGPDWLAPRARLARPSLCRGGELSETQQQAAHPVDRDESFWRLPAPTRTSIRRAACRRSTRSRQRARRRDVRDPIPLERTSDRGSKSAHAGGLVDRHAPASASSPKRARRKVVSPARQRLRLTKPCAPHARFPKWVLVAPPQPCASPRTGRESVREDRKRPIRGSSRFELQDVRVTRESQCQR
jgi:hypothetical protein